VALNGLEQTPAGYELRHSRHVVTFSRDGFLFTPRGGGTAWQLTAVQAGEVPLPAVDTGPVWPVRQPSLRDHGGAVPGAGGRDRAAVPASPATAAGGANLVIAEAVRSAGTLALVQGQTPNPRASRREASVASKAVGWLTTVPRVAPSIALLEHDTAAPGWYT